MNFINTIKNFFINWFADIESSFIKTFIREDRWLQLLKGLGVTLQITVFAAILGIIIGFIIAAVRSTYDRNLADKKCRSFGDYLLKFFNAICNIYLTVIRGTPVVIQLMIIHFIVLASVRNGIYAAIFAFGINSGAYVAEIVRSGIMSIDKGQFEAGRSLGFNYLQTMWHIIIPQAFKNILPALGNEFIVLIKETSVAGYVALKDITYVGNLIRSRTYEAFFPLITVAVIYLMIVMLLSYFLKKLERRLRNSDH
ncbi:MAG: amino acid ABC transporter permease [Acutalibacteraceae bacterium]|nr:amino acid ABC transporter permease [Acutalibacteraceae bacterium]